jgi:hypothetical protein
MGGRKKGQRDRATVILEKLFASNVRAVGRAVVQEAKVGRQPWALKLLVERLMAPAKEEPIAFDLKSVRTAQIATQDILAQAAEGKLSLSDAERICSMLAVLTRSFEAVDHAERLEALEQRLEQAGVAAPLAINGRRYDGLQG